MSTMKSLILLTLASSTAAFVPPASSSSSVSSTGSTTGLTMSSSVDSDNTASPIASTKKESAPKLAGDYGFDPLSFAKDKETLFYYREMEMKHARLAMLAAAGWPMSELLDRPIAEFYGIPSLLDTANRAPSFGAGGLEHVSPQFWGFCVGLTAAIDSYTTHRSRTVTDYTPGDLGWDPLSLSPSIDNNSSNDYKVAEIQNGRLAMLGVTGFAVQEYVDGMAVVDETPLFFQPITETLEGLLLNTAAAAAP